MPPECRSIGHPRREAPLVVIPSGDAYQSAAIHACGLGGIERATGSNAVEIRADEFFGIVVQDTRHRPARRLLERGVDGSNVGGAREIDVQRYQRDVWRGHANGCPVQSAGQFRQHQAQGLGGAGAGRDHRQGRSAGAVQILVQRVDRLLVAGITVDRHHVAALDAVCLVQHLGHRRQAVGRAGRVADHRHLGAQDVLIHTHHDGSVDTVGWCRNQHAPRASGNQGRGSLLAGEQAGTLHRHIDAGIRHFGWIPLGRDADRPVGAALMANRDGVAVDDDLTGKPTMHAIVAQQMGVGLDAAEIVDRDRFDVRAAALHHSAQHQPADAPEPVDRDFDCPCLFSFLWCDEHTARSAERPKSCRDHLFGPGFQPVSPEPACFACY